MNLFLTIICITILAANFRAQAQNVNDFNINNYENNIFFITMDTSHSSQTTVIEYPEFLVLIELPFIDEGAGKSTDLSEDIERAEEFIKFINDKFKNKPVKFVMSSHWHLHSLSGITPFFKQGTKLITTENNWQYSIDNGFLGTLNPNDFNSDILKINKDTTLLSETNFPIQVIYLDSTYKNKPTKDYLFFYFGNNKTLHASCMCALSDIDLDTRKDYVYSDRLTDLNRVITDRNLTVENIIKLGRSKNSDGNYMTPVYSDTYMNRFMDKGKPMIQAVNEFTMISEENLIINRDSILNQIIIKKVSTQIINQAVYECIKLKEFKKAVALAQLLNLYSPGDLNLIDTMGEAYYNAGELALANYYNLLIIKKDPKFGGGIKVWEQNKINSQY